MLHHPHTNLDELLTVEDQTFEPCINAYLHCKAVQAGAHPDDYYDGISEPLEEEEFEEDPYEEDEVPEQSWQELTALMPQDQPDAEAVDLLGNRAIGLAFDWDSYIGKFPQLYV
ncbi:hypothetical protein NW767_015467 [Fusarium falciforme]|nr:hypothetical protein NW767_015467 [Fusarium falciforme]